MRTELSERIPIQRFSTLCFALIAVILLPGPVITEATPTTLHVALYPYVPDRLGLFHQLEAVFEQEHPGVNVELVESEDLVSDYYSGGLQKVKADVYEIDTILLSDMVEAGKIAPVQLPQSDFTAEAIEAVTRQGQIFGVPHWLCGNFLFYRKGDTEIEKASTWQELSTLLASRGESLFVDFKGSLTLGEWYFTVLAELHGVAQAQQMITESTIIAPEVVSHLSHILTNCPAGFCRSDPLHDRTGYYARAFAAGRAGAYIGYSESWHPGLQYILDNCVSTSGCVAESDVTVRRLPAFQKGSPSSGIGWIDALAIDAGLSDEKRKLAGEFIAFVVSDRAYRRVLEPAWGQAPRYLLPARKLSNIENAPLYDQLYQAHAGRKTGTFLGLNSHLREFGRKLDCALPIDRTDTATHKKCASSASN